MAHMSLVSRLTYALLFILFLEKRTRALSFINKKNRDSSLQSPVARSRTHDPEDLRD
jgi:hypothetical protein